MKSGVGKSTIKAVIFDLDGVLIDAKDWHYEALNRSLSLFGLKIPRDDHLITYDGLPTKKKLDMLTLDAGLPKELHPFINRLKQNYTMEIIYSQCKPMFHHEFLLSRLKSAGIRLAVCSNSIRETLDLMIRKAGLESYLEFTMSNQDVSQPKPHPEIYTKAIERLKLQPRDCLVIEDNPHGIKAAEESGAHILRVTSVYDVNYANVFSRIQDIEDGRG